MKQTFVINSWSRQKAIEAVQNAGDDYTVTVQEPTRSGSQNRLMWALLTDISIQVVWHGQKLTPENWKDIVTAGLKKQDVVPGLDGGFVVLGTSTRRMTKLEMNELIEFIYYVGAKYDVKFSEQELNA